MNEVLNVKDVAKILGFNERTIRKMIRNKEITGFFKIGYKWRIKSNDLDAWMDKQKEKS